MSTDSSIEDLLNEEVPLKEVPMADDRKKLFIKKLKLCCIIFDFTIDDTDHQNHQLAKEKKRIYLMELIEYISPSTHQFTDDCIPSIIQMIAANLFRPLPPPIYDDFDPEEDDPYYDPSWPHLQLVYEFFHRFTRTADSKFIRRHINKPFLLNIIDLFKSGDPRERDYLKSILHRIYGRVMAFRSFIRKAMHNALYPVIYSNQRHDGISELLEIFGAIINGFRQPLAEQHKLFLNNVLIPLHKVSFLSQFHPQLIYCVTQFIQKDPSLASSVIGGMLKFWPKQSCQKEILFLDELEEVIGYTNIQYLEKFMKPLFHRISQSICSKNFLVAERAFVLFRDDIFASFTEDHRKEVLPILYPALKKNYATHWNPAICTITVQVMRIFIDMDEELYEEVAKNYKTGRQSPRIKKEERESKWKAIQQMANKQSMIMQ